MTIEYHECRATVAFITTKVIRIRDFYLVKLCAGLFIIIHHELIIMKVSYSRLYLDYI
jgi:hypothetical protein